MTGRRPAAFLDRDGTIIDDVHYLAHPDEVVLIPSAARAIRRLNEAGVPVVIVTNQSGIARGMFTVEDFERVQAQVLADLADAGAKVDATYYCPHHPEAGGPCDCRKPEVGMYLRAAADLALDVTRSLFVGDRWRDVAPAIALGGHGYLVPAPHTEPDDIIGAEREANVAASIEDAVEEWLNGAAYR